MRNSTLLCWRDFLGIALQARHPNENLENNLQLESFSVSSVCSVDYSVATLEILEEICIKEWPGARNQSSDLRRNLYGNKIFK